MFKRNLFALLLVVALLAPMSAVYAEDAEPITIHIYGIGATLPEDDPVIPELEKRLGIDIVIDAASSGTSDEAGLMTRIAGGDIPDVFKVNNINSLSTYYKYGVLLNLSDYMDMMPNIAATFQDTDWARLTFDGGIYGIPRRAEVNYMANYIRYDWLEKLGMECPTTFDELYDLCEAIRDGDLDGH
ncbi:MAG: extracellular solute-binding protein, partial [Eubacteriales bacterium]|nr:extracellular solute-binding protein [Eubacteriales bacterium]